MANQLKTLQAAGSPGTLGLGVPWSTSAPGGPSQGWGCLGVLGLFWVFLGAPQGAWTSYRNRPAQMAPSACRTKIYLPQKWSLTLPSCPWPSPPLTRNSLVDLDEPRLQPERPLMLACTVLFVQTAPCCCSLCCTARAFGLLDQGWA